MLWPARPLAVRKQTATCNTHVTKDGGWPRPTACEDLRPSVPQPRGLNSANSRMGSGQGPPLPGSETGGGTRGRGWPRVRASEVCGGKRPSVDQETGRSPSTHVPFLIANPHLEPSPLIFSKLELPFRWDKNHPQRSPGCIYLFIYNLMFRIFF